MSINVTHFKLQAELKNETMEVRSTPAFTGNNKKLYK